MRGEIQNQVSNHQSTLVLEKLLNKAQHPSQYPAPPKNPSNLIKNQTPVCGGGW